MFLPVKRSQKSISKAKRDPIIPDVNMVKYDDVCQFPNIHATYLKQALCKNGKWIAINELPLTLLKSALEGALVRIVDAKQTSYVGISGILLMETKYTFVIINESKICKVMKRNTKLEFDFNYQDEIHTAIIYGNAVVNRLFNKKYKSHNTIEFF
eukprot:NODE_118_length_18907_cov_0.436251.p5 type:complete len:155 gc:universal NODE_118_length_18907_cov_0.436251:986-1450(+)